MKKNRKKYYGVAGENGYGVFDDYDKVLESRKYLQRKYRCKSQKTFEEAKEWAEDTLMELRDGEFDYEIDTIQKINWVYYVRSDT